MHGIPARLQTRDDFERVHAAALAGEVSAGSVAQHWRGLLAGQWTYEFDRVLADGEEPDGPAPDYLVLSQEDGGRRQERRVRAQGAAIDVLGYSEADVLAKLEELEGV